MGSRWLSLLAMKIVKRTRGYTRVSPKHQVTIPADAMARAGLRPGDRIRVTTREPGEVVLTRVEDPIERFAGALDGVFPAGQIEALRDEWR